MLSHQPSATPHLLASEACAGASHRPPEVVVVGAGLAGSEAAWQAAEHGARVTLYEMRPRRMTPAHRTGWMAELVCSNSLGSDLPDRALGLLKNELRRLGSLIIACADRTAVPAGGALAVDRLAFSQAVTQAIASHPNITVVREEVTDLVPLLSCASTGSPLPSTGDLARQALQGKGEAAMDPPPSSVFPRKEGGREGSARVREVGGGGRCTIMATGPLTSPSLAEAIRRLAGQDYLSFFDAMAPIVTAESIDMSVAFRADRWGRSAHRRIGEAANEQTPALALWACGDAFRGPPVPDAERSGSAGVGASVNQRMSGGDYINCPLDREQYYAFVEAVKQAEKGSLRDFEQDEAARRYFEACLPIEVLAGRDPDALAFGPMTPVGLWDPRTGRRPFAVVQLRQDDVAGTLYNLVGFQTNIKWGAQERVLRTIPGLERAEFVRFGQMHRNTFIDSPRLLRPTLQWHDRDDLFFAGQIIGTEGYVGSTASGLFAGLNAVRVAYQAPPFRMPLTTMIGALCGYVTRSAAPGSSSGPAPSFQPMKANFGLLPELEPLVPDRRRRHAAYAARARADLDAMLAGLEGAV